MPRYDFKCPHCQQVEEIQCPISEMDNPRFHEHNGQKTQLQRLFTPGAIHDNAPGFYGRSQKGTIAADKAADKPTNKATDKTADTPADSTKSTDTKPDAPAAGGCGHGGGCGH